jgi:GH15 family glucan-1,4-alpha-glucosidase
MRAYTLGNGSLHIGVDDRGQVRDVYFPHVGLENHVSGRFHRIGIYVDGTLSWLTDNEWQVTATAESETFGGTTTAHHERFGVTVMIEDTVYNERDIFIRAATITNHRDYERDVRIFFGHEFYIWDSLKGDTGYYDPEENALVHYKGRRVFLMSASIEGVPFDQYSVGVFGIEGKEGSFRDAEDGELSMNPIEHGVVDSIMRVSCPLQPNASRTVYYWLVAGRFMNDIHALNAYVHKKTPQYLMKTSRDYWSAWLSTQDIEFADLPDAVVDLYKKSLFVIRSHTDKDGSIIASSDSDILNQGRDTYSYMWPRDAAYAARALILAGDTSTARQFFSFCNSVITEAGYFKHKYLPDGAIGSSWHPWVRNGKRELPIQEDETAIVLVVLKEYYTVTRDIEFVEQVFNSLVRSAGDFLTTYIDSNTNLPHPSYDLWEERYIVSTYTCSATYAGIKAAAFFASLLGKDDLAHKYTTVAERMQEAILAQLYDGARGTFYKSLSFQADGTTVYDPTIDISSVYGICEFDVLPHDDPRVVSALKLAEEKLMLHDGTIGGMPRFENDYYYRTAQSEPPNPWNVTTLWRAHCHLARAKSADDLVVVKETLDWVVRHATQSGMLSEQLHPRSGAPLGTTPLVWSHAEFVTTVIEYLQKMDDLGLCRSCYPLRRK